MRVRPVIGGAAVVLVVLLAWLQHVAPAGPVVWPVALATFVLLAWWVQRSAPSGRLGPADLVTLLRGVLACVAAGPVVAGAAAPQAPAGLVVVCTVALALDAVDGQVARRTRTASAFGGRFDGETDALLMLVLSVAVAPSHGWWVLALGVLRYAFGAAAGLLPWLTRPLPYRWWRKVATAVAGVALVAALPGVVPEPVVTLGLVVALALLLESFGRDVRWAWQRRQVTPAVAVTVP